MSTPKPVAEALLAPIQQVADARMRAMMGGWLVYADEVLIGQMNEGELFVKESPFLTDFAADLERRPPHEGAKPAAVVPPARLEDGAWVHDLVAGSVAALRKPARAPR